MIRIFFKGLDRSELAKQAILERLNSILNKYPELKHHRISVTVSMENSPQHPGPDQFSVKFFISGRPFSNVVFEKSSPNFYIALADAIDGLNHLLSKKRVREIDHQTTQGRDHL